MYCLVAILAVKQLRKTEFVMVFTQTLVDLLFSGLAAFAFYAPRLFNYANNICFSPESSAHLSSFSGHYNSKNNLLKERNLKLNMLMQFNN